MKIETLIIEERPTIMVPLPTQGPITELYRWHWRTLSGRRQTAHSSEGAFPNGWPKLDRAVANAEAILGAEIELQRDRRGEYDRGTVVGRAIKLEVRRRP